MIQTNPPRPAAGGGRKREKCKDLKRCGYNCLVSGWLDAFDHAPPLRCLLQPVAHCRSAPRCPHPRWGPPGFSGRRNPAPDPGVRIRALISGLPPSGLSPIHRQFRSGLFPVGFRHVGRSTTVVMASSTARSRTILRVTVPRPAEFLVKAPCFSGLVLIG